MTYSLIMYCKNKHEEKVCSGKFRRLRDIAVLLIDRLYCKECGEAVDEWSITHEPRN